MLAPVADISPTIKLNVMDLGILQVLITRLLERELSRLVEEMEPVELWEDG
jgi:hypothetical protein